MDISLTVNLSPDNLPLGTSINSFIQPPHELIIRIPRKDIPGRSQGLIQDLCFGNVRVASGSGDFGPF